MKGYVFKAGAQSAITKEQSGSNLPAPKVGSWAFAKEIRDVTAPGLIGFDPDAFAKQGYQLWPNTGGIASSHDPLTSKDI
ncbi:MULTISPECIES: hypothetical protein [Bradyrhizobium]|uniref:Uncharacterized protein n=1 Tax=Bradyrhizobium septentrionale TaxID=1404411 RepID=A0A973VWW4_9BRAD|nr:MULTISPECIES: hypothetical protein [Bradyrhizobium]QIG97696.1 hypothetical protein G6P99_38605 [Bradyrhizobium sp. 6(2017)]UGY20122.1 hypothetical protein HAP48_0023250 [Bradyrhizobium septentrionale]UGY28972.1 hypothetical protein HU675_0020620 [Bradyrhizobium septentrionale]